MDTPSLTEEYRGYTIQLWHDSDPEDPLTWTTPDDRGAAFALYHRRYTLPMEVEDTKDLADYDGWAQFAADNAPEGMPVWRYVQWYEHSGVSVSLSDTPDVGGWDSGCAGVIFGTDEDTINSNFRTWKHYIEGEVYGYVIEDEHGEEIEDGSLWGLYGYDDALAEAKQAVDADIAAPYKHKFSKAPNARELHR